MSLRALRIIFPLFVFSVLVMGILLSMPGAASAACPNGDPPCVTRLTEQNGFVTVFWSGNKKFDHYNIRERSGTQVEAPGTDRSQLHNQRNITLRRTRFVGGNRVHFSVQGCTRTINIGPIQTRSNCTAWSPEVTLFIDDGSGRGDDPKSKACQEYARRAVGAVKLARDTYRCDPKVISGDRWTDNFDEHLRWCVRVPPASANAEDRARNTIMHRCRLRVPTNALRLTVVRGNGDFFQVSGTGFPVNAPLVLRLTGPAVQSPTITNVNGQMIVSNAQGAFNVRVAGVVVCNKAGQVTFVAEERDHGRQSNAVTTTCRAN